MADVIARPLDEQPPGGSLALLDEITLHGGGCALNTASVLSTLGVETAVVGKVGADPFGDFLLGLLDERGVRREGVVRDERVPTSATVVLVDSAGERTFLHVPGANGALGADELDESASTRAVRCISRERSSWRASTESRSRASPRRRSAAGSGRASIRSGIRPAAGRGSSRACRTSISSR